MKQSKLRYVAKTKYGQTSLNVGIECSYRVLECYVDVEATQKCTTVLVEELHNRLSVGG